MTHGCGEAPHAGGNFGLGSIHKDDIPSRLAHASKVCGEVSIQRGCEGHKPEINGGGE